MSFCNSFITISSMYQLTYQLNHRLDRCAARNQNLESYLPFLVCGHYIFLSSYINLFISIFRSRSRSPAKPTSNISSIVKPAILREEPIPGSEQGNLLKGIDKKTGRREGKEPIKRVFTQCLFSVTHSLQGNKMFGNCSLFLYIVIVSKNYFLNGNQLV